MNSQFDAFQSFLGEIPLKSPFDFSSNRFRGLISLTAFLLTSLLLITMTLLDYAQLNMGVQIGCLGFLKELR